MLPEVGWTELLLIGAVALIVLKPEDLPALMRKLGLWSATLRQNMQGMMDGWAETAEQTKKGKK